MIEYTDTKEYILVIRTKQNIFKRILKVITLPFEFIFKGTITIK